MSHTAGSTWSATMDEQLAALWAEGQSTRAIAAALGRTKNGIVGRAHRLGLPKRLSLNKVAGELPPVRATRVRRVVPRPVATLPAPSPPPASPPPAVASFLPPPSRSCRWIDGDPKAAGGPRWCGEPSAGTSSLTACYCARHAARVISRGPADRAA